MTQVVSLVNSFNAFISGCKLDGTWDSIKASCVMAGWSNLSGALTPLAGVAPSGFNLASGDYSRASGLKGDGSTKYLDSNRNNNADPQNSQHMAVFIATGNTEGAVIGAGDVTTGATHILPNPIANRMLYRNRSINNDDVTGQAAATGFVGMSRAASSIFSARSSSVSTTFTRNSEVPAAGTVRVFSRSAASFSAARLSFYSIGESLDLALLDNRVTVLMSGIQNAIP